MFVCTLFLTGFQTEDALSRGFFSFFFFLNWIDKRSVNIGRFFRYILLLFLMHQMAIALFRLIGALGRSMVIANTFGSFALVVVFVLGGFILAKRKLLISVENISLSGSFVFTQVEYISYIQ